MNNSFNFIYYVLITFSNIESVLRIFNEGTCTNVS